ncbi:hypothetical protein DHD05_14940 [Arenibacter sp. N53]|nr:hypothetical protein [Arenibacter sp. N53]
MENPPEGASPSRAGKLSKYLLYAIGEIILVVIGILIALQINNWNESRKENLELKHSLELMIDDLKQDIVFYNNHIDDVVPTLEFLKLLSQRNYATLKLESMGFFLTKNFDPRNFGSAYYSLKDNNKLNLIKNKKLKEEVVNYYEVTSVYFNDLSDWHEKFVAENVESYIFDNFPVGVNANVIPAVVIEKM